MNQRPQSGKTILPIFTPRKRPRQAVIAHPNDRALSTTGTEPSTSRNFSPGEDVQHPARQRISTGYQCQDQYGQLQRDSDGYFGKAYPVGGSLLYGDERLQAHANKMPRGPHSLSQTGHPTQPRSGYYHTRTDPSQGASRASDGGYPNHPTSARGPRNSYASPPMQAGSTYGPPVNNHFRQQDYKGLFYRGSTPSGGSQPTGRLPREQSAATPRLVFPKPRSSSQRSTTPQTQHSFGPSPKKATVAPTPTRKADSSGSKVSRNRFVSSSIGGMKHWSQYRHTAPLLFEVYGFVQGSVENGSDGVSKLFKLRDKQGSSIRCQFWEMERVLPLLTPGKPYRCVGTLDHRIDIFKCVKVRQATPMEFDIHQKRVTISDQSMKACFISEKEP